MRTGGGGDGADDPALTRAVLGALRTAGLVAAGVAPVEVFQGTRRDLHARRAAGLHAGMQFTYRDPERSTDPARILRGARSIVVGAYSYLRQVPARDPGPRPVAPGRVARYAWSDHYAELRLALGAGVALLRHAGFATVIVADDNALVDREAARRAGVGWYGRNANLLVAGAGSWVVLGSIVTDAPLQASEAAVGSCGTCTRCLGACPTAAIVEPGVVDARRCLAWLLQATGSFPRRWRVALGDRLYGCDDCQEVCPPNLGVGNLGVDRHRPPPDAGQTARPVADAATFLELDDDAAVAAAGRWYVAERKARYLRRNALVVLANTADPHDPRVVALLVRSLAHPDPLVRAHAVWAAARLGRPELADALVVSESDPAVREELDLRGEVPVRAGG